MRYDLGWYLIAVACIAIGIHILTMLFGEFVKLKEKCKRCKYGSKYKYMVKEDKLLVGCQDVKTQPALDFDSKTPPT